MSESDLMRCVLYMSLALGSACSGESAPPSAALPVQVTIAPATATVAAGASRQFTASVANASDAGAVFTATGGTVSPSGLFVAGATAGTYAVIATHPASGAADTAQVTVTVTPPPAASCAAPPAEWLFCDDFDIDRSGSYFEIASASGSFTRVAGIGRNGSSGLRARFAAGQVDAGAYRLAIGRTPQSYFRSAAATGEDLRDVYWRFYLRREPGWQGGGGDKLTRATVFGSTTSWAQAMIAHGWSGSSTGPDRDYIVLDPARGTNATGTLVTTTYNDGPNLTWLGGTRGTATPFSQARAGEWQCYEFRVRLNDAGSSNGRFEFWLDGVLDASRTNLNWLGNYSAYGINAIFLENYWNSGSPIAQERYFDDFVVSRARIGC